MTSIAKGGEAEPGTRASEKRRILNDMQVLGLVVLQGVFLPGSDQESELRSHHLEVEELQGIAYSTQQHRNSKNVTFVSSRNKHNTLF